MPYKRYGTRVGRFRSRRRTVGKRKSYRRLSSRKVVTRRVLQRAIKPLRPEIKSLDMVNTYQMNVDTGPIAFEAICVNTTAGNAASGPFPVDSTSLSVPIPLTQVSRGTFASQRIGQRIRLKSLQVRLFLTTTSASANSRPFRVSVYVMRSKNLGQYLPGYSAAIGSGVMYPHVMPMAGADSPVWWYHQTADIDSFPDPDNNIGIRRGGASVVYRRTFLMNPGVDDNAAAGTPFTMPIGGTSTKQVNFSVPIARGQQTYFNDQDASYSNGYFSNNHYWLTVIREADPGSATCVAESGQLRWRMTYTDA